MAAFKGSYQYFYTDALNSSLPAAAASHTVTTTYTTTATALTTTTTNITFGNHRTGWFPTLIWCKTRQCCLLSIEIKQAGFAVRLGDRRVGNLTYADDIKSSVQELKKIFRVG